MAGYSKTLNECYLTSTTSLTTEDYENLILHMKGIRKYLSKSKVKKPFISKHWAPENDNIQEGERTYFT